ncbi:MAG: HNH endonuclease [Actinomycetota bacterium]|nr:HNH endonuclease [Actinomycetota bacterium]
MPAEVDHFIPHVFQRRGVVKGLDRVWNLVLACPSCNRGSGGKSDLLPAPNYLERLHKRNEYLIASHHPLRETLMGQLGSTTAARAGWLWSTYKECEVLRPGLFWSTPAVADPAF